MILCLNLNAAVDKTVIVNSFQLGHIHRPEVVKSLPGGKGCNVARALKRLGTKPVVAGWVGGAAGHFIENGLKKEGIDTDFVYTDFESRTCLSIFDSSSQTMTELYERGDPIPGDKVHALEELFQKIISRYEAVTLSGSLPPGAPHDFYAKLIAIAHVAGVPTFLDSSGQALLSGIKAQPFLVKPNEAEVAILTGQELHTIDDLYTAAVKISRTYETIVVLSIGQAGAICAGRSEVIHVQNPPVAARSAVGSGDCLLGGLAYGFSQGFSVADAVKYGVAAGTANTLSIGAGQFQLADFETILAQTRVNTISI